MERCLCMVCIDDDVLPGTFNNPYKKEDKWIGDRDYANVLHHTLHGGGSRHLGANRWFDKTFHAILGKVRIYIFYSIENSIFSMKFPRKNIQIPISCFIEYLKTF